MLDDSFLEKIEELICDEYCEHLGGWCDDNCNECLTNIATHIINRKK